MLQFIETPTFTKIITNLVDDDEYAAFQRELSDRPEKGGPMAGCGGVRKARMAARGKGKSGGARIIYLYLKNREVIYLLYAFTKGDADNISAEGKMAMRELAEQIKAEYR